MIKIKLSGHEFRYEVYHIVSLFYEKSEIKFVNDDDYDIESILMDGYTSALCNVKCSSKLISEKIQISCMDKKHIKNAVKKSVLRALKKIFNKDIPWGVLVGIRPTKIVHECIKEGMEDSEIKKYIEAQYDIYPEKAALAVEVARYEENFLKKQDKTVSAYINIPFCPTRCVYCSFTSNPVSKDPHLVDEYLMCLEKEITDGMEYAHNKGLKIDTLYIGGGTPTSINEAQLESLLKTISSSIDIKSLREFTVEAGRPDSITRDKLKILKNYGVTRISINPQTMNDETLKRIGRLHSSKDIIDKYHLARDIGFDSINMDIIIGLPGEGMREALKTIDDIKKLSPENITVHIMSVKRASKLGQSGYLDESTLPFGIYDEVTSKIRKMDMHPYYMYRQKNMVVPLENIGYCKKDKECIYNIQMIAENISILAFGTDAITKLVFDAENRIERIANVKDVQEYIKRIDEMINKKIKAVDMISNL